ncbi:hypothetical protein CU669_06720 [Paramagnetospirillum kuznetsovii]|uniref:DUF2946 domain-containing protein n=2 Tax=Paramagnetospirillum kuznetsovii TaxID=2053833 RepID=A0A364NZQ8_9PROT|nr:hypothetical protein CU669_06720 [Paramagnetospirillum kuznetsovii]
MRAVRAKWLCVIRLLLLALSLQLLMPFTGLVGLGHATALEADLNASLCHDGGANGAPLADGDGAAVNHCIFCLPLVGGHAINLDESVPAAPMAGVAVVVRPMDHIGPLGERRDFAFARGPPAFSQTI